ncbi:DUF6328 family protein [Mycolicibacterium mucogenicum]|uniref:Sodium:proton antiporter n=1 Tax=Mycolicibacterium mucogenicum TaxID=56689 RepID=A0A4R5WH17_MYCMU|nr:hypothetical protein EUA03_12145 [Mycolicibacterium mucogenicum]
MTGEHGDEGPSDQRWDRMARHETEIERLDRNWSSLLQELRVAQTGVQLLTGFLMTLPFQQRFTTLDDQSQTVYPATVAFSVASAILLIAPVGMHRILFRQRRMSLIVAAAHRCAFYGLLLLGMALTGVASAWPDSAPSGCWCLWPCRTADTTIPLAHNSFRARSGPASPR